MGKLARAPRRPRHHFSLLLLEDGDHYITDFVATCLEHDGSSQPLAGGRLRLTFRALYFEPKEFHRPIYMLPLSCVMHALLPAAAPDNGYTASHRGQANQRLQSWWQEAAGLWASRHPDALLLAASQYVTMRENGEDAPYCFVKKELEEGDVPALWAFKLEYAATESLFRELLPLLRLHRLPSERREAEIASAAAAMEASARFDAAHLEDLSEEVCCQAPVAQVRPLVREPGCLVITNRNVYFQPLHPVASDSPVRVLPLVRLLAVARRRFCFRERGLELYLQGKEQAQAQAQAQAPEEGAGLRGSTATGRQHRPGARSLAEAEPSAAPPSGETAEAELPEDPGCAEALGPRHAHFFLFRSEGEREQAVRALHRLVPTDVLKASALLEGRPDVLQSVTAAWQAGSLSTFDYLLFLNLAAGRSFCDLAQWPVLPWVLRDYSSPRLNLADPSSFRDLAKPIGALNPSRLAEFRRRYRQMPRGADLPAHLQPFLFGTHYSTPGYVLYWLVRCAPGHMLRLQNGRFDTADRLFHSVGESWHSVLSNATDVKELIPEFFMLPADFLLLPGDLHLGTRQSGLDVGHVELPAWASDPLDFVRQHAAALESAWVSAHVHQWIDLVFGCKQRGEAAEASDNVFHPLTYAGTVDLDALQDGVQQRGFETQINEFGQTPRQLFTSPHPQRDPSAAAAFLQLQAALPHPTGLLPAREGSLDSVAGDGSSAGAAQRLPAEAAQLSSAGSKQERGSAGFQTQQPASAFSLWQRSPGDVLRRLLALPHVVALPTRAFEAEGAAALPMGPQSGLPEEGPPGSHQSTSQSLSPASSDPAAGGPGLDVPRDTPQQKPAGEACGSTTPCEAVAWDWLWREAPNAVSPSAAAPDMSYGGHSALADLRGWLCRDSAAGVGQGAAEQAEAALSDGGLQVPSRGSSGALERRIGAGGGEALPTHFRRSHWVDAHGGAVTGAAFAWHSRRQELLFVSVGADGFVKVFAAEGGTPLPLRSARVSAAPLTSLVLVPPSGQLEYPTVLAGTADDGLVAYSPDYGCPLMTARIHSEAVSALSLSGPLLPAAAAPLLCSASVDGTVRLWDLSRLPLQLPEPSDALGTWGPSAAALDRATEVLPLAELCQHHHPLSALAAGPQNAALSSVVAAGDCRGSVMAWDMRARGSAIQCRRTSIRSRAECCLCLKVQQSQPWIPPSSEIDVPLSGIPRMDLALRRSHASGPDPSSSSSAITCLQLAGQPENALLPPHPSTVAFGAAPVIVAANLAGHIHAIDMRKPSIPLAHAHMPPAAGPLLCSAPAGDGAMLCGSYGGACVAWSWERDLSGKQIAGIKNGCPHCLPPQENLLLFDPGRKEGKEETRKDSQDGDGVPLLSVAAAFNVHSGVLLVTGNAEGRLQFSR